MNASDGEHEVMVPRAPTGTYIRLSAFQRPDDDALVRFSVQAEAPGLSATIGVETLDGDGLSEFVQSLDDDFRGWPDERVWTSFRRDVELRAVHLGRVIRLSWTLRFPMWETEVAWTATVDVHIAPGEQLKALAADVRDFLGTR